MPGDNKPLFSTTSTSEVSADPMEDIKSSSNRKYTLNQALKQVMKIQN
jgi:hypothetical protein